MDDLFQGLMSTGRGTLNTHRNSKDGSDPSGPPFVAVFNADGDGVADASSDVLAAASLEIAVASADAAPDTERTPVLERSAGMQVSQAHFTGGEVTTPLDQRPAHDDVPNATTSRGTTPSEVGEEAPLGPSATGTAQHARPIADGQAQEIFPTASDRASTRTALPSLTADDGLPTELSKVPTGSSPLFAVEQTSKTNPISKVSADSLFAPALRDELPTRSSEGLRPIAATASTIAAEGASTLHAPNASAPSSDRSLASPAANEDGRPLTERALVGSSVNARIDPAETATNPDDPRVLPETQRPQSDRAPLADARMSAGSGLPIARSTAVAAISPELSINGAAFAEVPDVQPSESQLFEAPEKTLSDHSDQRPPLHSEAPRGPNWAPYVTPSQSDFTARATQTQTSTSALITGAEMDIAFESFTSLQVGTLNSGAIVSGFQPMAPGLPPNAPNLVAQQIAAALQDSGSEQGQPIELALDPPELGRVRLHVAELAGVLTLTIHAERPETAELMRRHLDLLAREFSEAGVDAPSVRVSQDGPDGRSNGQGSSDGPEPSATEPVDLATSPSNQSRTPDQAGALDLRL